MNKQVVLALASAMVMSGCVSMSDDPYIRSFGNDPKETDFDNELENKRLSYLGRYLVENETRAEIVANAYDKESVKAWTSMDYGTMTSMATDVAVGELGSSLGSNLGAAVSVGGMILGAAFSSDYDVIGQAWLPESFNRQKLDSSSKAHEALARFTEAQMEKVAMQFDYSVECIGECQSRSKVFLFERQNNNADHPKWGYQPERLVAMVNVSAEFEEVAEDDILPVLLGHPVHWKLPPYFTYQVGFYSRLETDEKGEVVVFQKPGNGYTIEHVKPRRDLLRVPLGRMMMQAFHDTPFTIYANDDIYPTQLFFNGEAYRFFDGHSPLIIEEEVDQQWGD